MKHFDTERFMSTVAFHASEIMSCVSYTGHTVRVGFAIGATARADIVVNRHDHSHVGTWMPNAWDQCTVNGKHVGNRCGAREEYARIAAQVLKEHANGPCDSPKCPYCVEVKQCAS